MRCPRCGEEIANDSVYCEFCGRKIKKSGSKKLWLSVCVVSALVVIIYACFVFFTRRADIPQPIEYTSVEVSTNECTKLKCENDSLTEVINNLKEMLRDKESQNDQQKSLKAEIESLKSQNASLQAKLKRYKELFNN